MQNIKSIPRKAYQLISAIIQILKGLSSPSQTLSEQDIKRMRRGQKPLNNNRNHNYGRGSGGSHRVRMGG